MPYKFEKLHIPRDKDNRVKLTEEQKEEIRQKYVPHIYSYNMLAKEYGVSKKLILLICNEKSRENLEFYKKYVNPSSNYYDREKHKMYMRKHREHKKELHNKGELIK